MHDVLIQVAAAGEGVFTTSPADAPKSKQKDRQMIRNLTWGGLVVIALITLLR